MKWHDQYAIQQMLSKANIQPDSKYEIKEIYNAIKSELNVNPKIGCARTKGVDGEQYLHDVQICLNKQLELIDCGRITPKNYAGVLTSCDSRKKVHYLGKVPKDVTDHESTAWRFLVHFVSIILLVGVVLFAYKWAKNRNSL